MFVKFIINFMDPLLCWCRIMGFTDVCFFSWQNHRFQFQIFRILLVKVAHNDTGLGIGLIFFITAGFTTVGIQLMVHQLPIVNKFVCQSAQDVIGVTILNVHKDGVFSIHKLAKGGGALACDLLHKGDSGQMIQIQMLHGHRKEISESIHQCGLGACLDIFVVLFASLTMSTLTESPGVTAVN